MLIEALIVSMVLLAAMAGGLFLHRLYLGKIEAISQARAAAWTSAMRGCSANIDLGAIWSGPGQNTGAVELDTDAVPAFFGDIGHASGRASTSVRADQRVGGRSYSLGAASTVACDEQPQDPRGDVHSLIGYISSNMLPTFSWN